MLPIAKEGLPFLVPIALLTVIAGLAGWSVGTGFGIILTAFVAYFFRNPKRQIPQGETAVLAPADGTIVHIGEVTEDRFLKRRALKISIFMSLFDVHMNRSPLSAKVIERSYRAGRFLVASKERSSVLNEQNALLLETEERLRILLVQIAGFVARRIVCYVKAGDRLARGQIFGLIRFGSRVDLYLPLDVKLNVRVGEHVRGGESILGYLR